MNKPVSIVFFGTPQFANFGLEALLKSPRADVRLVVTQPDREAGRGEKLLPPPVKQLAEEYSARVLQPEKIKKTLKTFLAEAEELGPFDLGVVSAFGQILPQAVLDLPKHGCVNIHASLLPRWRGAAPIHRALLEGDKETGVCLMRMDAGLDTGSVYSRAAIEIAPRDNLEMLHDKLGRLGAEILIRDLDAIVGGSLQPQVQNDVGVTYANKIQNEEAEITWSKDSVAIDRQVRALSPMPGAFTWLGKKRLKIYRSWPERRGELLSKDPGEIVRIDKDLLEVACGKGTLMLEELQLEGKKRLDISAFVAGNPLKPGSVLGPAT